MPPSPAKRRKVSPTRSVPGDASTPANRPATPPPAGANATPRYPSFASPTKASIARRQSSQTLNRSPSPSPEKSASRPQSRNGPPQRQAEQPDASNQTNPAPQRVGNAPLAKMTNTPGTPRENRSARGGLLGPPRRTPRKPNENIPTAPAPGGTVGDTTGGFPGPDDIPDPFRKRGLRRSPVSSQPTAPSQPEVAPENSIEQQAPVARQPTPVEPVRPVAENSEAAAERPVEQAPEKAPERPPEQIPDRVPEEDSQQAPGSAALEPTVERTADIVPAGIPDSIRSDKAPKNLAATEPSNTPTDPVPEQRSRQTTVPQKAVPRQPAQSQKSQPEEPELPPTPTQRGIPDPVVTTPPSGIHNTPSKKPRQNREIGKKQQPSPLKQTAQGAQTAQPAVQPSPAPETARIHQPTLQDRLVPFDPPETAKKRLRDQLAAELEIIEADLKLGERESERIRKLQESGKDETRAPPNADEILQFLSRSTASASAPQSESKKKTLSQSITSLLPFAIRKRRPKAPSLPAEPPASHHPVPVSDPLPYLQLFTSLTFTSTSTLIPAPQSSTSSTLPPLLQQSTITVSFPQALLSAATIILTVAHPSFSVHSLGIARLDPSAELEFGTWARSRCSKFLQNSAQETKNMLGGDVNAVFWALNSFVEMSRRRAVFWANVEEEFGSEGAAREAIEKMAKSSRANKGKRKRRDEDEDGEEEGEREKEGRKWKRRELLKHMGRTSMLLGIDVPSSGGGSSGNTERVEVKIEWRIGFDWTGEAEAVVGAKARVPRSWQAIDSRSSLSKIPSIFDKLVAQVGPLSAVRGIVGVLAGVENF